MSACFPVAAESLDSYFNRYRLSGLNPSRNRCMEADHLVTRDHHGAISPFCYAGVETLKPSHWRAQNPKHHTNLGGAAPTRPESIRQDTATHTALHHATSILYQKADAKHSLGVWKAEMSSWMLGRKDGGRGLCYLGTAPARSILHLTSNCQWKTNSGHVSLRPYKGVSHVWRQELSNCM